ncbi:MAG: DNA polymerase [SAR324 cluster bacterium]|nr:DNA polymerase [SAR324 cluster bacterium]
MKSTLAEEFEQVWAVDFEFREVNGNLPEVHCMVARELFSGQLIRTWISGELSTPCPIPLGKDILYVAYYATAELKCHLALGWPLPTNVLDLFVEFRCQTNGKLLPSGNGLLGALIYFGLSAIAYTEKEAMRKLAIRGGPFSICERCELTDYCQGDVDALVELLPYLTKNLNLGQTLLRGRYMKAVAQMENNGIPIDVGTLTHLQNNWEVIKDAPIQRVDVSYGVFDGNTFKKDRFADYLRRQQISWPLLPSGSLDLKDDTFRQMARTHSQLSPLRELRHALGQMRLNKFEVGNDSRARTNLRPFRSKTGRNQPSTASYIFGSSIWLRGLIKPKRGFGVAYIDWSQQEIGIAAALSGDKAMQAAYHSGDPYLEFAKLAKLVPADATKKSHPEQRKLCKAAVLAVQYGMGAESLAIRINQPLQMGRELLANHRRTFPDFWQWSDAVVSYAMLHLKLWTVFGWYLHLEGKVNARSLANFPMQANGAEILRLACCYMTEAGISVCAPVHDAVLIEAPLEVLDEQIAQARALMAQASRDVLNGFELGTDVEEFRFPERYCDEDRGGEFWDLVMAELNRTKFC